MLYNDQRIYVALIWVLYIPTRKFINYYILRNINQGRYDKSQSIKHYNCSDKTGVEGVKLVEEVHVISGP